MKSTIAEVIRRLEGFISGVDDAWSLPAEAARFVHSLVLATRAARCVEIGTGYGYSTLWIAAAVAKNDGRLITIDRDARKSRAARSWVESAGLSDCIDFRTGEALEILRSLDGPVDFVLNDADKEHCAEYVQTLTPKLADRAVIVTDNTLTHAAQLAEYLAWLRDHPGFCSAHVPIGNGMELTVKVHG